MSILWWKGVPGQDIDKDDLFEGIQAMLDEEGIDAIAEEWVEDPGNLPELKTFLNDYALFRSTDR